MKAVASAVKNAIRSEHDVVAIPRLTVEWNYNRYVPTIDVDNTPAEQTDGFDIEAFPIESIILPNRPGAGILKARVGEARIADPYSKFTGQTRAIRSYLGSVNDTYKYWSSPYPTNSSGVFPLHTDGVTTCRPHVNYVGGVKANRIVVGFEDSWARPKNFTVRVATTAGGPYTAVSTNPTINSKGQVILNWDGSWSTTNSPSNDSATFPTIYGIEVRVDSLQTGAAPKAGTGANSMLSLIEISARRVHDLTDRLVSVNDTFDMSEVSLVYPVGTLTSNTASVTLFNGDGVFNAENTSSPYYGLMEPNAVFNLDWIYTIDGSDYVVPEFTMLGDAWSGQRADTVSVDLTDFSKVFQEVKPRPSMYLNNPVSQVIWRLCDSIGFVDYEIQLNDTTNDNIIKVWYTDGTKTMWELLDDLAKGTQTAIYFDGYGKLQVRSRTAAFDATKTPSWTLRGDDSGTELADIIEISQTDELESNDVIVNYNATDVDPVVNGFPRNQVLWAPEGTVTLRACPLYASMTSASTSFVITPADAKVWPYKGMVNIEGEIIKYEGKEFIYYVNGVRKSVSVKTADDYQTYNAKSASDTERTKNFFSGRMYITERGVWNSTARPHSVDASGYSVRQIINDKNHYNNAVGLTQKKAESRVYLGGGVRHNDATDLLVATTGNQNDQTFFNYGCKLRFEKNGGKTQEGGIVINNRTDNEDGYYIDIIPTAKISTKMRANRNEVVLYTRNSGKWNLIGKGATFAIAEGVDYEIDVQFRTSGSNHILDVWINGQKAFTTTLNSTRQVAPSGRFGMFNRGDSTISYDYLYAMHTSSDTLLPDDFSYLDRVRGSNYGGQLDREAIYGYRTVIRRVKKLFLKVQKKYLINFFDEFGPVVHEIREFNVNFTKGPAVDSHLYMSNDWGAVCPEYSATAWGAKFYIANSERSNVVINGEDSLTYAGSSKTANNVLAVIGRSITVADDASVEARDELQIRKRGEIQTEVSSTWIQSKDMATEISNWIKGHWSAGADQQEVTIFGNPLIELGDVVSVNYPDMDMSSATHKYFVVGVRNSFDTGLDTTVTLRRVV